MNDVKKYLAKIGRKGGLKSRRKLDAGTAKKMVLLREARKAFKKFHAHCFWSCDPNLKITYADLNWVGMNLLKYGNMKTWTLGRKLCP